jgi:hypothetical protein
MPGLIAQKRNGRGTVHAGPMFVQAERSCLCVSRPTDRTHRCRDEIVVDL